MMGESSEWIAACEGCDGLGSRRAHNVRISAQEDRSGTAGKVGQGAGGEEEVRVGTNTLR
jgi:hypothetical protein